VQEQADRDVHDKSNLRFMDKDMLLRKYRELRHAFTRLRIRDSRRLAARNQLREQLKKIEKPSTTVDKLIGVWRWIDAQGGLDEHASALVSFSENLAKATRMRLEVANGTRKTMRGMRWGMITKKIFGANKVRGQRSANRSMKATFKAGITPRTVDKHVKSKIFLLDVEDDEQNVIAAAALYKPLIARLGFPEGHYVPFESQADETGCNPDPEYCRRRRLILQLCGALCKAGEGKHTCDFNCYPCTRTYESIVNGVMRNVHGTYITIVLIRPLIYELPPMVVRARATCNSFDAASVLRVLTSLRKFYAKHLTPIGMRESGHGSNGDARRVYAMLRNSLRFLLSIDPTPGARHERTLRDNESFYRLNTPGFIFAQRTCVLCACCVSCSVSVSE
jgi:hypothetical protein